MSLEIYLVLIVFPHYRLHQLHLSRAAFFCGFCANISIKITILGQDPCLQSTPNMGIQDW